MTFGATFGRAFAPPFSPRTAAAVASGGWWLSGGIAPANCIAAYQAKGAASYAGSKSNLANPGTYDLTEGSAPGWDATNGWDFVYTNGNYLITSSAIPVTGTWSIMARFSGALLNGNANCIICSAHYNTAGYRISPIMGVWTREISYAGAYNRGSRLYDSSHVWGFAGNKEYLDGSQSGAVFTDTIPTQVANRVFVVAGSNYDGNVAFKSTIKIQALVVHNITLTDTQVGLLTTAMNAL